MKVVEIQTDTEAAKWDRYVIDHPGATGYHLMAWRGLVEKAFGHRTIYLMVKDEEEEVHGVLPLVFLSSRLFGRFLISLPFVNYGGLLTDREEARVRLLDVAVEVAKETRATHIELRQQEACGIEWPCKQHKVSMRLPLPRDFETLWKGFPSKLRSQIRRAQQEKMTIAIGGGDLLDPFYEVFSLGMRDLGTPVYGKSFFRTILETFPKEARILVVSQQGKPLAAGFVYGFGSRLEIPWAASDRRYNRLAPNMLLYSAALEYACREGCREFDFGRSTIGSGTFRFKQQWGATAAPLYWYYWLRHGGELPELNPQNPKFDLAIRLWSRLPVALTRIVGPFVVRSLP